MDMVFLGMVDPQSNYSWYFWLFHCLIKVDLSWQCVSNYHYSYTQKNNFFSLIYLPHTVLQKANIQAINFTWHTSFVISSFWILCHFFILDSLQRPKYLQATSFHVHPTKTSQLLVLYTIPNLSLTHFLVHSDDITYCIIVFYFIVHDSLPYDQSWEDNGNVFNLSFLYP